LEENREWLSTKLGVLTTSMIDEMLEATREERCTTDLKLQSGPHSAFRCILRAIEHPNEALVDPANKYTYSTHGDNRVATKNAVQCFNFRHRGSHIAGAKYFPTMKLTQKQKQAAQSRNGNNLCKFLLAKININDLDDDIREKAKKLSTELVHFSGIDGMEIISLMETDEEDSCIMHSKFPYPLEKVHLTMARIVQFLNNPTKSIWKLQGVAVCQNEEKSHICFRLDHAGIIKVEINIPLPPRILPEDPHVLEQPFIESVKDDGSVTSGDVEIDQAGDVEIDQDGNDESYDSQVDAENIFVEQVLKNVEETIDDYNYDDDVTQQEVVQKLKEKVEKMINEAGEEFSPVFRTNLENLLMLLDGFCYGGMKSSSRTNFSWISKKIEAKEGK
jgi:hypothetical protein